MKYPNHRMQLASEIARVAQWLNLSIRTKDMHRARVELGLTDASLRNARGTAVINTSCVNLAQKLGNKVESANVHQCFVSPKGFLAKRKGDPEPRKRTSRPIASYDQVLNIVKSLSLALKDPKVNAQSDVRASEHCYSVQGNI